MLFSTFQTYGLDKRITSKTDKMKESYKHASLAFCDSSSKKECIQKAGQKFPLKISNWTKRKSKLSWKR